MDRAVLALLKTRVKNFDQLVDELRPFLQESPEIDAAAGAKYLTREIAPVLLAVAAAFGEAGEFDAPAVEQIVRRAAAEANIKAAPLIHAIRVALTGRTVSAGLFELTALLGASRAADRLRRASAH